MIPLLKATLWELIRLSRYPNWFGMSFEWFLNMWISSETKQKKSFSLKLTHFVTLSGLRLHLHVSFDELNLLQREKFCLWEMHFVAATTDTFPGKCASTFSNFSRHRRSQAILFMTNLNLTNLFTSQWSSWVVALNVPCEL